MIEEGTPPVAPAVDAETIEQVQKMQRMQSLTDALSLTSHKIVTSAKYVF